jgi:hypothetical protein
MASIIIGILISLLTTAVSIWAGYKIAICLTAKEREARRKSIKQQLVAALRFNAERAEQAAAQLKEGGQPNFPFGTLALNVLLVEGHSFIENGLFNDIMWGVYQMEHVNAKLAVINTRFVAMVTNAENTAALGLYREDLKKHYLIVAEGTKKLADRLEASAE